MRSLLLSCILALLPQNAFAEISVIGRYECTVKTTQLVIIEDGVAQKYSGYENGTDVGDKLIFEIKNFGVGNSLNILSRTQNLRIETLSLVGFRIPRLMKN